LADNLFKENRVNLSRFLNRASPEAGNVIETHEHKGEFKEP
jgi:hypothetical protein